MRRLLGYNAQSRRTTRMRLDLGQIEVIDDAMAAVLRRKTGAERLTIANGLFLFARQLIRSSVRARHPDWGEERVACEVARRISDGSK